MPITITITDPTPEQIAALFGAPAAQAPEPDREAAPEPEAKKPARRAPAKAKKAEPVEEAPVEEVAEEEAADEVSEDDVREAAQALAKAEGRDALKDLLAEFKADKISSIKPAQREAFVSKARATAAG